MPSLQKAGGLKFVVTTDNLSISSTTLNLNSVVVLEASFATTKTSGNSGIICKSGRYGFFLNGGSVMLYDWVASATIFSVRSNLNDGKPHHVVVVLVSGVTNGSLVYIDGVLDKTLTYTITSSTPTLFLGSESTNYNTFTGILYFARIYNRALSPSEVYNNYQGNVTRNGLVGEWLLDATSGTTAIDTSGNANHGTLSGGTWMNKAVKQKPKKNMWNEQGQAVLRGSVTSVSYNSTTKEYAVVMGATSQSDWGLSTCYGDNFNPIKKIDAKQGNVFGISATITGLGFGGIFVMERDINGTTTNPVLYTSTTAVHTVANVNTVVLEVIFNGNANQSFTVKNIQVEKNVVTAFEPYTLTPDLASAKTKPKKNLIPPFSQWTNKSTNATILDSYKLQVTPTAQWQETNIEFRNLIPGQTYTFSGNVSNQSVIQYYLKAWDISNTLILDQSTVNKVTFTYPTNAVKLVLACSNSGTTGTHVFDSPQLELGSTATVFEPLIPTPDLPLAPQKKAIPYRGTDFSFSRPSVEYNGMTVPMDTPRVDGNGVMVEEGTVNLAIAYTSSNGGVPLSNVLWWSGGGTGWNTPTINSEVFKGKKTFKCSLKNTGGTDYSFFRANVSSLFSNGDLLTWTIYVKKSNYRYIGFRPMLSAVYGSQQAVFDFDTGITYANSPECSSITAKQLDNGWWEVKISRVANPDVTTNLFLGICIPNTNGGAESGCTLDGREVIVAEYMQVEKKAYATTFTDNPLGRQPETLTFPTANVLNASAGTIEVWAYENGQQANNSYIFDMDGSSRFLLWKTGGSPATYTINANNTSVITAVSLSSLGFHLYAVKWSGTQVSLYIDGILKVTTTLGSALSFGTATFLALGVRYTLSNQWNNPIKSLRISNVALSDGLIYQSFLDSNVSKQLAFNDNVTKLLNF